MQDFKKAFISSLLILLCTLFLIVLVCEAYFRTTENIYQDAPVRYQLAGTIDTLVCGASQARDCFVAVDYNNATGSTCYNMSTPMITMKGRYLLLKKELERNPVHTVILELSFNSLSRNRSEEFPEGDLYQLAQWDTMAERAAFFLTNIRPDEYPVIFHDAFQKGLTACIALAKGSAKTPQLEESLGYLPLDSVDNELSAEKAAEIYMSQSLSTEIRPENMEYLEKIIALCKEKNIRLIILTVPLSEELLIQHNNFDDVHAQYQQIAETYGLEFYDFNLYREYSYEALTDFSNANHMSLAGAVDFTHDYLDVIRLVDNGQDVAHLFYDSYLEIAQVLYEEIWTR